MVYVTGQPAELWSFWPPTFTFTKIGDLSCTQNPTHMTVDRNGTAWVVGNAKIYKTSTKDATCAPIPTWSPFSHLDFLDFALSFVGVTNNDTTLYLLGPITLAKFDIASGNFQYVGVPAVGSAGTAGDMTSNGDGTLYFLQDAPTVHTLFELDPSNANIKTKHTVNSNSGSPTSQALAFFGARFYAFENSVVYEYDPVTDTNKQIGTAPLQVTGAGQSTCVPETVVDAGTPPPPVQ
jgi:hypothetical protein